MLFMTQIRRSVFCFWSDSATGQVTENETYTTCEQKGPDQTTPDHGLFAIHQQYLPEMLE